ncbi:MAG: hypothetical protein BSOLF_0045 [Candidatus Carbobacillus altaicus]|uniref:Uncharacterized protein n=1 Tax=Candidatus Carbonibacillus altaicus TaxID=2163959 RepID=A0A2R6XXM6_9BACL|nr:MAG: hypothetical protein BSOLF_0045 [Candidatus Carbobacillus altaicus]
MRIIQTNGKMKMTERESMPAIDKNVLSQRNGIRQVMRRALLQR